MYKITLALKYFIKRKITYFAVLAVTLCVFIVVVVMTVTTDLYSDFKEKNHQFAGDCVVGTNSLVGFAYYEDFVKLLSQQEEIAAVTPVIKSFALIRQRGSNEDSAIEIMGIEPDTYNKVTGFVDTLYYNRKNVSDVFSLYYDPNLTGCVLGDTMTRTKNTVYPDKKNIPGISYSISCFPLTPYGAFAQAGTDLVNTKTFYLSDLSNTGLPRVDGSVIYLPFEEVQKLCGMAGSTRRVSRIQIKFAPSVKAKQGTEIVRSLWDNYAREKQNESQAFLIDTVSVQSWKEFRRESIAPMENEQAELILMFGFVGLTTIFIVLVVFYMIISHKSKDIGILKSIGVSKTSIIELFSIFALLVGLLSSAIGLFAGWIFLLNVNRIEGWLYHRYGFQLWDRTIYAIGDIPNRINFTVLAIVAAAAILACLIGAFFPSYQAARKAPADILQVNQL
jgi:lipoprotein-releasing system permease protein